MAVTKRGGGREKQRRRRAVIERDGAVCRFCGATEDLTLDHIVPRSIGGPNAIQNLQILCRPCNNAKGNSGAGREVVLRWRGMAVAA